MFWRKIPPAVDILRYERDAQGRRQALTAASAGAGTGDSDTGMLSLGIENNVRLSSRPRSSPGFADVVQMAQQRRAEELRRLAPSAPLPEDAFSSADPFTAAPQSVYEAHFRPAGPPPPPPPLPPRPEQPVPSAPPAQSLPTQYTTPHGPQGSVATSEVGSGASAFDPFIPCSSSKPPPQPPGLDPPVRPSPPQHRPTAPAPPPPLVRRYTSTSMEHPTRPEQEYLPAPVPPPPRIYASQPKSSEHLRRRPLLVPSAPSDVGSDGPFEPSIAVSPRPTPVRQVTLPSPYLAPDPRSRPPLPLHSTESRRQTAIFGSEVSLAESNFRVSPPPSLRPVPDANRRPRFHDEPPSRRETSPLPTLRPIVTKNFTPLRQSLVSSPSSIGESNGSFCPSTDSQRSAVSRSSASSLSYVSSDSEPFSPVKRGPRRQSPPPYSDSETGAVSEKTISERASRGSQSDKNPSEDASDDSTGESEDEAREAGRSVVRPGRHATVRRAVHRPIGLNNLGNSCYLNSTLQCLAVTEPLASYLLSGEYRREINTTSHFGTKGRLTIELAKVLEELRSASQSVSPRDFRDALCKFKPQFRGYEQQDAQEFLGYLLDGLHEDLNLVTQPPPPIKSTAQREAELEAMPEILAADEEWMVYRERNDSIVIDFFQGQFTNKMECMVCGKTSTTFNAFQTLSLPIPSPTRQRPQINLSDCMNEFLKEEVLTGDDAWNCPRCRKAQTTSKRLSLARLPQFLILHLKRFTSLDAVAEKVYTAVHFPLNKLELGHHLPPEIPGVHLNLPHDTQTTYRLYAVVNHFQDSKRDALNSGHYTALVRSKQGGWFDIGDDEVELISEQRVLNHTRAAYLLFYEIQKR